MGLMTWIDTYGRHNLAVTGWFFVLLVLLFLLCCNTFVCTTERTLRILRNHQQQSAAKLLFRLAPHCMHYALLLILVGYLCSYLFSIVVPHPDTGGRFRIRASQTGRESYALSRLIPSLTTVNGCTGSTAG